jgi:hypothetical protein
MAQKILAMKMQHRCCSAWCWAAVISAIIDGLSLPISPGTQGGLVNTYFTPGVDCTGCCPNGCPDLDHECNLPAQLGPVLNSLNLASGNQQSPQDLKFSGIQAEIDAGRPLIAEIDYDTSPPQGHALLIYGYADPDALVIGDPANGQSSTVLFSAYSAPDAYVDPTTTGLRGTWKYVYLLDNLENL